MRREQLETLIRRLERGVLTNAEVFDTKGHGAAVLRPAIEAAGKQIAGLLGG